MKKAIVYVDGQNFLYKIKPHLIEAKLLDKKGEITAIDLPFLVQRFFPDTDLEIRYYGTGRIKRQTEYGKDIEKKTIAFADALRRLRSCLKKTGVVFCAAGSLKVRNTDRCKKCKLYSFKLQEKGVDVGLAVDLVADALTKRTRHIILLGSDTDLIPAIKRAKDGSNVKITFIGFDGEVVRAISAISDDTKVLHKEEIIEAYTRVNKAKAADRKPKKYSSPRK